MLKAKPAERWLMVSHWWRHQATDADKNRLIDELVTPYQNAKYGIGDRDDETPYGPEAVEERDRA
jgi:hypothetical protein